MASKLRGMKMPMKAADEMELGDEFAATDEAPTSEEEAEAPASALESISDEELLAELKKRGLTSQLDEMDETSLQA